MSYLMLEYLCPTGHRTESLEVRGDVSEYVACGACGRRAVQTISAVKFKTCWGSVVQGKSDPPPSPMAMDAAGPGRESRSLSEWKEGRAKKWRDYDRAKRRAKGAPL